MVSGVWPPKRGRQQRDDAGVVDQHGRVGALQGSGCDRGRVGHVEADGNDAGNVDAFGIANAGIHLGGATPE